MDNRQPLIDMLSNMSQQDMYVLFDILDLAHEALIYESTDEVLIMDQFMTSLWIAARGNII